MTVSRQTSKPSQELVELLRLDRNGLDERARELGVPAGNRTFCDDDQLRLIVMDVLFQRASEGS